MHWPATATSLQGFSHVLCVSWRDDNGGPPASPQEALAIFAAVRAAWPGARVVASTLDDYLQELLAAAPGLDLPVVTSERAQGGCVVCVCVRVRACVCVCVRVCVYIHI